MKSLFRNAAAGGAARLYRLDIRLACPAAADVTDDLLDDHPHRDLDKACVFHLADQAEDLGAGVVLRTDFYELPGAPVDDDGYIGPGLDVVDRRGLAFDSLLHGEGRPLARLSHQSFDRLDQGRFLAAHESAGTSHKLDIEGKAGAQNILTQDSELVRLPQGDDQMFDRQRIFISHVDHAVGGPGTVGADDHPLDNTVRISLQQASVHVSPGVPLVRITHKESSSTVGLGGQQLPLQACWKTRPTAAAQAGRLDLLYDPCGFAAGKHLFKSRIASVFDIVVNPDGIHLLIATEESALLRIEKRNVVLLFDGLACSGVYKEQILQHISSGHGLDDPHHGIESDLWIKSTVGLHHHRRLHLAEAVAPGDAQVHLLRQLVEQNLSFRNANEVVCTARLTASPCSNYDRGDIGRHVGKNSTLQCSKIIDRFQSFHERSNPY